MLSNGAVIANRYRLVRLIATGGMGQVWEAVDNRLDRHVAVKVPKAEFSADSTFRHRFRTEARTTAQLTHPGIAAVYDYGETQDPSGGETSYLVMELVAGEPLNAVLGRLGRLSMPHALDMLEQTGRALEVAHSAGVVHRDVKPGNILVTPTGQVKITDFGIAKAVDASPVTKTGMVMGTAQYIAPEQALGQDATSASDVYSLGVVGYEALSGARPFLGDGALTVAMKHVREAPAPLPSDLPPNVRELIEITMTKDPAARYGRGGEFADAVAAVRAGRRPPPPGTPGVTPAPLVAPGLPTSAGGYPTGAGRVLPPGDRATQAMPSSQREYAGPATGYTAGRHSAAAVAADAPTGGLTQGQRLIAWIGGALLVAAAALIGFLLLRGSGDDGQQPPAPPPTTTVPSQAPLPPPPPQTTRTAEPTTEPKPPPVTTTTTTPPPTTTTTTPSPTPTTTTTTTQPTTTTTKKITLPSLPTFPSGQGLPIPTIGFP